MYKKIHEKIRKNLQRFTNKMIVDESISIKYLQILINKDHDWTLLQHEKNLRFDTYTNTEKIVELQEIF